MRVKVRKLEGQDHFVVPVVMIVEGVLPGSNGAIQYPARVLRESVERWNARPVVVYHPDLYGESYAGKPEVFDRQKVGVLFNTRFDGKRLMADAWINIQRARQIDVRVLHSVHARQQMEVSTGLGVVERCVAGVFDGQKFERVADYLEPDHLALLPDRRGACDLEMGCGLLRN